MKQKSIKTTNKIWKFIFAILFVVVFVAIGLFVAQITGRIDINKSFNFTQEETPQLKKATISRVVDGDTYEVYIDGYLKKVRLIGVDTPESVHPDSTKNSEEGINVSEQVKQLLPVGKVVYLEYETQIQDIYNRDLVDLWLSPVDLNNIGAHNITELFNFQLVSMGYASVATYPPNTKYANYLSNTQGITQ